MKQKWPNAQNIILSSSGKSCTIRSPTVHWVGYDDVDEVRKVRKGPRILEGLWYLERRRGT